MADPTYGAGTQRPTADPPGRFAAYNLIQGAELLLGMHITPLSYYDGRIAEV
jgi:hypothetical protein